MHKFSLVAVASGTSHGGRCPRGLELRDANNPIISALSGSAEEFTEE